VNTNFGDTVFRTENPQSNSNGSTINIAEFKFTQFDGIWLLASAIGNFSPGNRVRTFAKIQDPTIEIPGSASGAKHFYQIT
jgi:hypothetical protein